MKIFGIHILTTKGLKKIVDSLNDTAHIISMNTLNSYYNRIDIETVTELERLKKDHWDKEAFDRLIGRLGK